MSDEIKESAKALQEASKATKKALEVAEKLGPFFAKCIGEPTEEAAGLVTDKLKFVRWKRQVRFVDRTQEILRARGHEGNTRILPPKFVLPIIENASYEDNDTLQDIWAHLLASALDPGFIDEMRGAFIDILRQLEVVDIKILNIIYLRYRILHPKIKEKINIEKGFYRTPSLFAYDYSHRFVSELGISSKQLYTSIDNLLRVRCIVPFVERKEVKLDDNDDDAFRWLRLKDAVFTFDHQYEQISLTSLGVGFIEACTIYIDEAV